MTAPLTPNARQGNTGFAVSVALLLIRVALAAVFIYSGSQKLFGWFTPDGQPMVTMLAQGLAAHPLPVLSPAAWAYIAAYGELLGGVSMLLGFVARLGAIPLIITMLVAIATVHGPNGFAGTFKFVTLSTGEKDMLIHPGYEFNLCLIAMAGAILIAGPGLIAADAFLFRRGLWARGPQPLDNPMRRES